MGFDGVMGVAEAAVAAAHGCKEVLVTKGRARKGQLIKIVMLISVVLIIIAIITVMKITGKIL